MRPGQLEPNEFEFALLSRFADQEPSIRAYLERLHVLSREFTGMGSFAWFLCDESNAQKHDRHVGLDALIRMPTAPNGMGAVLFCKSEQPECLEVHSYSGFQCNWPVSHDGYRGYLPESLLERSCMQWCVQVNINATRCMANTGTACLTASQSRIMLDTLVGYS